MRTSRVRTTRIRSIALALLAAAGLLSVACGSQKAGTSPSPASSATSVSSPAGAGAGPTVVIRNVAFNPPMVTATVGETVTWRFDDSDVQHTVTADDGSFDSGAKSSGTFTHTFAVPGTVTYHCSFHANMSATVTVVPAG